MSTSSRAPARRGCARCVLPLLLMCTSVLYCLATFLQQEKPLSKGISDFSCFYSAGKMVEDGDAAEIYNYDAQKRAQQPFFVPGLRRSVLPFVFVPFVLVVFAPLALLSYTHALILWYSLNVFLLLSVPFLLRRKLDLTFNQLGLAVFVVGFFLPSSISLAQGQPTILVLVLFTLIYLALEKNKEYLAGALLAFVTFKPQFAIPLLIVLVITSRWKALLAFSAAALSLLGVSAGIVGWETTLSYPQAVAAFTRLPANLGGEYGPEGMSNVRGLLLYILKGHLSSGSLHLLVVAASVLLTSSALYAVFIHRRRRLADLDFSLILIATVLGSYHAYKHDLVLLLLPIFLLARYVSAEDLSPCRLALGMSAGLLLILPSLLFPPAVMVAAVLSVFMLLMKETLHPEKVGSVFGPRQGQLIAPQEASC